MKNNNYARNVLTVGSIMALAIMGASISNAGPTVPTGLGPDIEVSCPDGHKAFYNPGWPPGHNTAASAHAICATWHNGSKGSHNATAGQYRPRINTPVKVVVKAKAISPNVGNQIPEPSGCNPNNLPGNQNPC